MYFPTLSTKHSLVRFAIQDYKLLFHIVQRDCFRHSPGSQASWTSIPSCSGLFTLSTWTPWFPSNRWTTGTVSLCSNCWTTTCLTTVSTYFSLTYVTKF